MFEIKIIRCHCKKANEALMPCDDEKIIFDNEKNQAKHMRQYR